MSLAASQAAGATPREPPARSHWPELAACALVAVGAWALRNLPLNDDVSWQFWLTRQMANGARLYVDIVEINPPLWFWMSLPVHSLAGVLDAPPAGVFKALLFAVMAASLLLVAAVHRAPPLQRAVLHGSLLLAFTAMVLPEFGEREHYVMMAAAPYVALAAARRTGRRVGPALAIAVGLFAASAFALKHYFALVPLALEAWLLLGLRGRWTPARPELGALAAFAAAYGIAIAVFTPEYVGSMVPLIGAAYHGYNPQAWMLLFVPVVPLTVIAVACIGVLRGTRTALGGAAFAALLACFAGFLLQQKGWRYHSLPALGMLVLVGAAEMFAPRRGGTRSTAPVLCALLGTAVVAIMSGLLLGPYHNDKRGDAEPALAGIPPGESVLVLAVNSSTTWPMVEERRLVWPSRFMTFWMVPAIARAQHEGRAPPALERLAAEVRHSVLADLLCRPPRRILVDDPRKGYSIADLDFDYLRFFRADPQLAAFLDRYRPGPRSGRFSTLELVDTERLERPSQCRPVH